MRLLLIAGLFIGLSLAEVKLVELTFTVTAGASLPDVVLSEKYPESASIGVRQIWHFKSSGDTKINLICTDLRIAPSDDCEKGYLAVNDGKSEKKHCGSASGLVVRSEGNELTVTFELIWASGLVKCSVTGELDSVPPEPKPDVNGQTETIHLPLGSDAYDKLNFHVPRNFKQSWKFTTNGHNRIVLYCNKMTFVEHNSQCQDDGIFLNDRKLCYAQYYYTYKTNGNYLNMEIKSGKLEGDIDCLVQAVNGSKKYQYENMESTEYDSSEDGTNPGTKSTTCQCGWSSKKSTRILNGKSARLGQFPWMVTVELQGSGCGGSILTQRHVLTAAHCTDGKVANKYPSYVWYGSNDSGQREKKQIIQIIDHQYDRDAHLKNDISILVVEGKFQFSENIGPICLTPNSPSINHQYVLAMGWGWMGEGTDYNPIMQYTHLRVIDYPTCDFIWYRKLVDGHRLCALASNRTACSGDSGGSVVWLDPETNRYVQLGVKSFAAGCNTNKPLVNALVPHYFDWIQKVISETDSSMHTCQKEGE